MSQESDMHVGGESDGRIVPSKCPNNSGQPLAEDMEGRRPIKENIGQTTARRTQSRISELSGLLGVRKAARKDERARFTALLHHVSVNLLRDSYYALKREAAPGVDGTTWKEYETDLDEKLADLHCRIHQGTYRAQPSKRAYIPKADGRQRPLGIAALEDKKVNWILDADIRGFFDNLSHEWLVKFIEHRIADRRIVRLVQKWLRAGVSEEGKWSKTEVGTPQGAVASLLLANVYLHYAFDLWVRHWRKHHASGDIIVVRYADDIVMGLEKRDEAERFLQEWKDRLQKFGLELHPDKTRLIEFGRHAAENRRKAGDGKPVFYSVRSERLLMEQLDYNLLFRWFVGLEIDEPVWNHAVFSKNRDRLLNRNWRNASLPRSRGRRKV